MGTNYYFYQKYHANLTDDDFVNAEWCPSSKLFTLIGCGEYEYEDRVRKLSNGYLYNDTYYSSLDTLNNALIRKFHIGKSSSGWHFLLAIYPEYGINNLDDWKKLFEDIDSYIKDEYDDLVSVDELLDIITNRKAFSFEDYKNEADYEAHALETHNNINTAFNFRKYATYDELLSANHAERGKNGLWAHKADRYTTRTDGTYDYIISGNSTEKGVIFS